jgi:hypothetical protein
MRRQERGGAASSRGASIAIATPSASRTYAAAGASGEAAGEGVAPLVTAADPGVGAPGADDAALAVNAPVATVATPPPGTLAPAAAPIEAGAGTSAPASASVQAVRDLSADEYLAELVTAKAAGSAALAVEREAHAEAARALEAAKHAVRAKAAAVSAREAALVKLDDSLASIRALQETARLADEARAAAAARAAAEKAAVQAAVHRMLRTDARSHV